MQLLFFYKVLVFLFSSSISETQTKFASVGLFNNDNLVGAEASGRARLGLWVRISPKAWMFVSCECCVLSDKGLCGGLITRPQESYRLRFVVVCNLEIWSMRKPRTALGRRSTGVESKEIGNARGPSRLYVYPTFCMDTLVWRKATSVTVVDKETETQTVNITNNLHCQPMW